MPFFTTKALREQSAYSYELFAKSARAELREAADEPGPFTFFLSHSFRDAQVIRGLRTAIRNMGFSVYVDWIEDAQLDRNKVTRRTAAALRDRMDRCRAMLYATSPNAEGSSWMPWEAGYFDGVNGRVAILPLYDEDPGHEQFTGREYLSLYPYVVKDLDARTRRATLWVMRRENQYVRVSEWLKGSDP